jgi:general secretion pathway protein K
MSRAGIGGPLPRRQGGVALIIALILVALATILATKLSFDGWLERQRAVGTLAAEQALHFGMGAEALAADVLSQSNSQMPQTNGQTISQTSSQLQSQQNANNTSQMVTLAQAWAQPTQPLPITPENNPDGEPIGTLQGALEDMSGRFNLNNLGHVISGGAAGASTVNAINGPNGLQDPFPLQQFQRLLVAVGLEPKWAGIARDWIDADDVPGTPDGAEDAIYTAQTPPYRTGNWPMMSPAELMNLPGFGADRYRKIAPYVTALPTAMAKINICTAPGPVLESLAEGLNGEYSGDPQLLVNARKTGCFPEPQAFNNILGKNLGAAQPWFGTTSSYFRLTTHVTLGTTEFTLYSLLYRSGGGKVTPLLRTFGTP